jgi:hypothetical protein
VLTGLQGREYKRREGTARDNRKRERKVPLSGPLEEGEGDQRQKCKSR